MAQSRSALVDALPRAVLALTGADGTVGTGFFVRPGLVLTCAHVVPEAAETMAARCDSDELTLNVVSEWRLPGDPDLALLRLSVPAEHPVVVLAPGIEPGDELWGYGHPDGAYRAGDSVVFRATGPSMRGAVADGAAPLHHVSDGRAGPGFSGGPVLNWRTGGICGVMRLAYGLDHGKPGARLITIDQIMAAYPFLDPPGSVTPYRRDWLARLDDAQIRHGGWRFAGPTLREYLQTARDAAQNHPYTTGARGGVRPPLSDVYFNQQLVPYGSAGVPDASLPRLPADAVLDTADNALIISGPGAGKSSMLRHIAATLADNWLHDDSPPPVLPVLIPASALLRGGGFGGVLRDAVHDDLGAGLWRELPGDFFADSPVAEATWLVIVDGVDEVLDPRDRQMVLQVLAKLWRASEHGYRLLAATRPLPSQELEPLFELGAIAYMLEPFNFLALREFAAGWLVRLGHQDATALADRFVEAVDNSDLVDLAGVPLIATMLVSLFAESPQAGLPRGRTELYEEFVDLLLSKMHRGPSTTLSQLQGRLEGWGSEARQAVDTVIRNLRGHLENVALRLQENSEDSPLELALTATADDRPPNVPKTEWREVIRDALLQTGLISGAGGDLAFIHHTVQEFMAACLFARENHPESSLVYSSVLGPVYEGNELVEAPKDNSYARFVFSLWAKDGQDTGSIVLGLFDRPEFSETGGGQSPDDLPPGGGTGVAAVLLRERDAIPEPVRTSVVERLTRAALEHGRVWAASAIASAERELGCSVLAEMAMSQSLPLYIGLHAAYELSYWDAASGSEILARFAEHGPALGGDTGWRSDEGQHSYRFPVPLDEWTGLSARLLAAMYLADADRDAAVRVIDALVVDTRRPLWDRVRAGRVLAQLDSQLADRRVQDSEFPPSFDDDITVDTLLSLARTQFEDHPRTDLLTAWARDATRPNDERLLAARALAQIDRVLGVAVLRALVGPVRQPVNYSITTVDGVYSIEWTAAPGLFASDGMPLFVPDELVVAAELLAELDQKAAIETLYDRIVTITVDPLPDAVVYLLARLDRSAAIRAVVERLRESFGEEQSEAGRLLIELDREVAETSLLRASEDASFLEARLAMARLLLELNPDCAINAIVHAVELSSDQYELDESVALLDAVAPEKVLTALIRASEPGDTRWAVGRMAAARMLADRSPEDSIKPLTKLAKESFFTDVREEAQALLAEVVARGVQPSALQTTAGQKRGWLGPLGRLRKT